MTGKQKLLIIHLPRERHHFPFIFHVPPQDSNPRLQHSQPDALPTRLQIPWRILIPSLLCSPTEGPAVHVPPPATVFAVLCFVAISAWKVGCFSSHPILYRPRIADWNKRQPSQYGGHWNHIQDLR